MTMYGTQHADSYRRDGVSFTRLLWVAPLTLVVALAVNLAIKTIVQALDPSLADMGQLGRPLVVLTLVDSVLAVLSFAVMTLPVPHPIRWYRIVAVIALLVSLVPDVLLGFGGDARRMGSARSHPSSASDRSFPVVSPAPARPEARIQQRCCRCSRPRRCGS